jgi:4-amino-4-deoxy-L-arabinose transferase-like glycosyltransferase
VSALVERPPAVAPSGPAGAAAPILAARWLRLAFGLLLAGLTLATRQPGLDRYATIDESRWVGRAADFATHLAERDFDQTYLVGHPGVTTMWLGALGLGSERVRAFSFQEGQTDVTRREGYLAALVAAREPPLVLNALLVGLLGWLAWPLFGPGPAVVGGLLLAFDPFLAAHSRLLHLDALLTSFMAVAALAWLGFLRGGGWGYPLLAGAAGGLALLTKAPSVYLLVYLPAVSGLALLRARGQSAGFGLARLASGLALAGAAALVVCLALWPALRVGGLAVLRRMAEFTVSNGSGERDNYFLGRPVEDPGPLFYPLGLLFRATPLAFLGLVLLAWLVGRRGARSRAWPLLLLALYPAGFLLMMTFGQKKFDRYALPAVPGLELLAGAGLWLGLEALRGWWLGRPAAGPARPAGPRQAAVLTLALTALVGLLLWPLASVYPYHLAYYNPLLGGGRLAQQAVFVGWGEGLDQVADYLNRKPLLLEAPTVATSYHRALQAHLVGNGALPLERAELADYIVPYVNTLQRQQDSELLRRFVADQEPEYVVWLNGIEYARVYRGPHLASERRVDLDLASGVRLESIVLAPGSARVRAGDELHLRLRWRVAADPKGLTARVRLVGPDGRPLVEQRAVLAEGLREAGLLIVESRLRLPASLPAGDYALAVGLDAADAGQAGASASLQPIAVLPAAPR